MDEDKIIRYVVIEAPTSYRLELQWNENMESYDILRADRSNSHPDLSIDEIFQRIERDGEMEVLDQKE